MKHSQFIEKSVLQKKTFQLFRHGARAPTMGSSDLDVKKHFPNGLGQLTENGTAQMRELGKFFHKRYTENKLLSSPPQLDDIHIHSRANDRCLMSAALVGSEMISPDSDTPRGMNVVPIHSMEQDEDRLDHPRDCPFEREKIKKKCNRVPEAGMKWAMFEGFIYVCLGLHETSTVLKTMEEFSEVESAYTLYKNGIETPKWFRDNMERIIRDYQTVFRYNTGVNNTRIQRIKQGKLLSSIMEKFKLDKASHEKDSKSVKKKWTAFSTQDWILMALLFGTGGATQAIGETIPNFASAIMFEMYKKGADYRIKAMYRDGESGEVKPFQVRGCTGSDQSCSLHEFITCCNKAITNDPVADCKVD
ncbi:hypothetical protein Q1695_005940 [Nippostrongylus brasiliensis]|nr:hypothetical protein Q1695_005940 [Nippostrongylus brasiliensis]